MQWQWVRSGVALIGVAVTLPVGRAEAARPSLYRNVVNARFATVSNGPQHAVVVDVADPADRRAVAGTVARTLRAEYAPTTGSLLAAQYRFLRAHPPFRHSVGALAPFAFDDVVLLRSRGALLRGSPAAVRAQALTGGELTFTFDGWTPQELEPLQRFTGQAYMAAKAVYGSPAGSAVVRIVKDAGVPSPMRNGGGYFNASTNEIHLHPTADYLSNREEVHLNLLHLMLHAFHDEAQFHYDAWEEGFARAATIAALGFIDGTAEVPKTGPEITRYSQYYLLQLYDALNQPALGGSRFLTGSGWDGMLLWRNAMATAAWLKVYTERRDFFIQFNQAYYAQFTPELAGNVPALKAIAAAALGDQIEGRGFEDWYRRQHVLDTSVTPGEKLFVYNAPVFPTRASPPGENGYSQAAILQYFRTASPSGDETPLNGTCYPVAWGFDYNQELPLEAQDRRVSIVGGQGTVIPTFFNIGQTTAQRVTIDYTVGGETVRTFLPVTFTGIEPGWNDLLGVFVGANAGTLRATLQSGAGQDLTVVQGGFGGQLSGGELNAFSRTTLEYAVNTGGGPQTFTQQINTGFDYYLAILPVGAAVPRNVSQTLPAGIRPITGPIVSFFHDPAGNLGIAPSRLLLARWDPTLPSENRYRAFPLAPPWRPGRAFWVKLDAPRTLSIDGTPPIPDADTPIGVPFGWSQIGNPWLQAVGTDSIRVRYQDRDLVSFNTAVANGWIQQGVWRFVPGVGYQITSLLEPWEGVWIRVNVDEGLTLYVLPPDISGQSLHPAGGPVLPTFGALSTALSSAGATATTRRPGVLAPPARRIAMTGWRLEMSAGSTHGTAEVTIGEEPGASDGYDVGLDLERPPSARALGAVPALELVSLPAHTPPAAPSDGRPGLAVDVRGRNSRLPWLIELRTSMPGVTMPIALRLSGTPAGLTLREVSTGRTFRADRTQALSLRTDASGIARVLVSAAPITPPGSLSGIQRLPAAPGRVRFAFTTGVDAEVEARVFGRFGQPVHTLFRGLLAAGRHELEWEGRDFRGRAAPTGWHRIVVTATDAGGRRAVTELRVWVPR